MASTPNITDIRMRRSRRTPQCVRIVIARDCLHTTIRPVIRFIGCPQCRTAPQRDGWCTPVTYAARDDGRPCVRCHNERCGAQWPSFRRQEEEDGDGGGNEGGDEGEESTDDLISDATLVAAVARNLLQGDGITDEQRQRMMDALRALEEATAADSESGQGEAGE